MYRKDELLRSLFFDIETVSLCEDVDDLSNNMKRLWLEKYHYKYFDLELDFRMKNFSIDNNLDEKIDRSSFPNKLIPTRKEIFIKYASLNPEFSRVLSIGVGTFTDDDLTDKKIGCIYSKDELEILTPFKQYLDKLNDLQLAGFNIKTFDIPFLIKRYYINNIIPPVLLQLRGKKPWELNMLDTCEDWKNQSRENISLELLCETLNVKSSKDKFKNHEFTTLYYNGKLSEEDVKEYPMKDVRAHMECCKKLSY